MDTIVAFGYHDQKAPRHWNICKTLQKEGHEILECHTQARGLINKYLELYKEFRSLPTTHYPLPTILVTFPGHFIMPLAWVLTRFPRRKIIFDAFISLYDTNVTDRKRTARWHPKALLWYMADWISCHLADEVLLDTEEHKKYFVKMFGMKSEKIRVIYVGTRDDLFFPKARDSKLETRSSFNVLFYGTFIPLQGIEYIIEAAKILEKEEPEINFTLIGRGQTYPEIQALAKQYRLENISFRGPVPFEELPRLIHNADLCLGIFGRSAKTQRVIPHKVYDAVACGVTIITADTPAIREKFLNHKGVILCRAGNAKELAEKIIERKNTISL